jgi:hypothetical protein
VHHASSRALFNAAIAATAGLTAPLGAAAGDLRGAGWYIFSGPGTPEGPTCRAGLPLKYYSYADGVYYEDNSPA